MQLLLLLDVSLVIPVLLVCITVAACVVGELHWLERDFKSVALASAAD